MVKEMKTSPVGRKCQFMNCTRTLSIYNHNTFCHFHKGQVVINNKTIEIKKNTCVPDSIK